MGAFIVTLGWTTLWCGGVGFSIIAVAREPTHKLSIVTDEFVVFRSISPMHPLRIISRHAITSFHRLHAVMSSPQLGVVAFEGKLRIRPKRTSFPLPYRKDPSVFPFVGFGPSRGGHSPRLLS